MTTMATKLWIDDKRPAPDGFRWAMTSAEALQILSDITLLKGSFEIISFDHDLGPGDDTRKVLDWMIDNDVWPKIVQIHTANPVGQQHLFNTARHHSPGGVQVVVGTYAP